MAHVCLTGATPRRTRRQLSSYDPHSSGTEPAQTARGGGAAAGTLGSAVLTELVQGTFQIILTTQTGLAGGVESCSLLEGKVIALLDRHTPM